MLMSDLSLHRSNSHSVDTSCQRIRTEQKHTFHSKAEEEKKKKKRREYVMSVYREYKVRSVSQQQKAVKGKCKGRTVSSPLTLCSVFFCFVTSELTTDTRAVSVGCTITHLLITLGKYTLTLHVNTEKQR